MKNVVNNYSPAEVKVREATSNDPWGPSSSLMSDVADLTYNVVAFSEIMTMIWKRINDHGKNWRHVYKALVLLDYIIKTGSERVAQQCKENIFAIQTLKDFQFYDKDGKDQGLNVREKSKAMVSLLKDDERLKTERERALKAKERFAMASQAVGSAGSDEVEIGKPAADETQNPESKGCFCLIVFTKSSIFQGLVICLTGGRERARAVPLCQNEHIHLPFKCNANKILCLRK